MGRIMTDELVENYESYLHEKEKAGRLYGNICVIWINWCSLPVAGC